MIVIVQDTTWSDDTVKDLDKLALVAACAKGRHVLLNLPSMPPSQRSGKAQPPGVATWLSSLSQKLRQEIELVFDHGLERYPGANQPDVIQLRVAPGKDRWREVTVTPATAAEMLQRPLKLLLENRRNDLAFLLRMAEPIHRERLRKALHLGWVEPEMGGGLPELKRRLEALRDPPTTAERIALARLWVMFDRDANEEDCSRPSTLSEETLALCRNLVIPWQLAHHQLTRRSIECYVPAKTLHDWWPNQVESIKKKQQRRRQVEAFLRREQDGGMRREARHVFNFKKGLDGDRRSKTRRDPEQTKRTLSDEDLDPMFHGLHTDVRDALAKGFRGLAEAFSADGAIQEDVFRREVDSTERTKLLDSLFSRL